MTRIRRGHIVLAATCALLTTSAPVEAMDASKPAVTGTGPHGDPVECTVQTTAPVRSTTYETISGTTVVTCEGDVGVITVGTCLDALGGTNGGLPLFGERRCTVEEIEPTEPSRALLKVLGEAVYSGGQTVGVVPTTATCSAFRASAVWATRGFVMASGLPKGQEIVVGPSAPPC